MQEQLSSFLFALGILFADKKHKVWLICVAALGIVLSWGNNFQAFNYFMFDYFPGYNKFRSVTFTLIMPLIALNLLGFLGLEKLLEEGLNPKTQKRLLLAVGIVGGFALLTAILAGIGGFRGAVDSRLGNLPAWFLDALRDDRKSLLRMDAIRSLLFVATAAGVIYFMMKKKMSEFLAYALLIVLVLADMWMVDKRHFGDKNYGRNPSRDFFVETEADQHIKSDPNLSYRVFNLINGWNDARTSYHHKSIGGYHGAKMRRYQDLYDHCISQETSQIIQGLQSGSLDFSEINALNMLNARYFSFGGKKTEVVQNRNTLGNAWFVTAVDEVQNPDEELNKVCGADVENVAVVDASQFKLDRKTFAKGEINLQDYKPNYLKYESANAGEGLAYFFRNLLP